jgi:hypothetical protein
MTMWIGSIRLVVQTADLPDAGTDSLVHFIVLRDGVPLHVYSLDYPTEDDLERGASRAYDYIGPTRLPRINDQTPELPPDVGEFPPPYPDYGFEFSNGLSGHLRLRLQIDGDDMWIKDDVDLYVRHIRQHGSGIDTVKWMEDADWSFVGTWTKNVAMSADASEGVTRWDLALT